MPSQSAIRSPNLLAVAVSTRTRALAFWPALGDFAGPLKSPCGTYRRLQGSLAKTEAGRMHSLNVAGIMILLVIIALFVLAWLVV